MKIEFNESDKKIVDSYKETIKGLSLLLGPQCEFVIHSLENLETSVIAIENGYLSGRKVGSPITDKALRFINEGIPAAQKYESTFPSGKTARCVTIPIKNQDKLIALLCINLNLDMSAKELFEIFSIEKTNTVVEKNKEEFFGDSVENMMLNMMDTYCTEVANDNTVPYAEKNKEIILRLKNAGFFNLRGSAENLAHRLSISVQTVYANIRRNS